MHEGTQPTGTTPLWVKVFGIVAVVLALVVVAVMVFGNGEHGPGRHVQLPGSLLR